MVETPTLEIDPVAKPEPLKSADETWQQTQHPEKSVFEERKNQWAEDIKKILEEHRLYYDQDKFTEQVESGSRYLRLSVVEFDQKEIDNRSIMKERFFKAPLPNENKDDEEAVRKTFIRQVRTQDFLDERTNFPVTEVLDENTDGSKGPLYSVMNWYQEGSEIGFIHNSQEMLALKPEHAKLAVNAIRSLQHVEDSITPEIADYLIKDKAVFQNYAGFQKDLAEILSKSVNGVGELYTADKKPFHQVIEHRIGRPNFLHEINQVLATARPVVEEAQNKGLHLVHGDFAPNNLFLGDGVTSDKFIGLDFEWSGLSPNEVLASVYDFGNLRARAWNNDAFRDALDQEMIASYQQEGREQVGRVIVALGILRSHLNLAGYFENYVPEKADRPEQVQRREETEKDILKAWEVLRLASPSP